MNNTKITFIGGCVTILVGLFFSLWVGSQGNQMAILASVVFGLLLQLSIWFLVARLQSYPVALLITVLATIGLSYIPGIFVLKSVLLVILTIPFARAFWFEYRENSKLINWGSLFSLLFACTIFISLNRDVIDPFITEKIRLFALNPDTLFHSALSAMALLKHSVSNIVPLLP